MPTDQVIMVIRLPFPIPESSSRVLEFFFFVAEGARKGFGSWKAGTEEMKFKSIQQSSILHAAGCSSRSSVEDTAHEPQLLQITDTFSRSATVGLERRSTIYFSFTN